MAMTNFNELKIQSLMIECGMVQFGPGHSARNGYEFVVNEKGRRACFYDNRLWKDDRIEFTVMDYGKEKVYRKFPMLNLYTIKEETRYGIFTIHFNSELYVNDIKLLIEVAKNIV